MSSPGTHPEDITPPGGDTHDSHPSATASVGAVVTSGPSDLPESLGGAGTEPLRWRRVFPGRAAQLSELRRWLAGLLPDSSARDDAVTVAVELATNAIKHTASGRGGFFAVEVTWHPETLRITVADGGAPTGPRWITRPAEFAEHGRGLHLVHCLASRTGAVGDQRGRLVWADLLWAATTPAIPACDGFHGAIRDAQAALTQGFPSVPAWFGWSTLAWWALAGPGQLITAPTASELLKLLSQAQPSGRPGRSHAPPRPAAPEPGRHTARHPISPQRTHHRPNMAAGLSGRAGSFMAAPAALAAHLGGAS